MVTGDYSKGIFPGYALTEDITLKHVSESEKIILRTIEYIEANKVN